MGVINIDEYYYIIVEMKKSLKILRILIKIILFGIKFE